MTNKKPKRGEIWRVQFQPQVGSEIMKTRPALVLNIQAMRFLPTRIIVPIRENKEHHNGSFFYIILEPSKTNGLVKTSSVDCAQIKSFDLSRFQRKLGKVSLEELKEIASTVSLTIGYL